uniref:Uncharacterized protein n=1 Tax=Anguilla anguilla TaxID=7936 RepID=A0A0E9UA38_ANGAN
MCNKITYLHRKIVVHFYKHYFKVRIHPPFVSAFTQ